MYGQSASGQFATRMFRIEVTGLRQTSADNPLQYNIRQGSGSDFITVPYSRMNAEFQRVTRLGGKIVKIEPV